MRGVFFGLAVWLAAVTSAAAQQNVWIQIEAQPSLREAQESVRGYAAVLPDVAGFQLSGRWYGIALGPFTRSDAEQRLASLRAQGRIPTDAFIAEPGSLGTQFWPIGGAASAPAPAPSVTTPEPVVETVPELRPADQTVAEARAAENLLSRDEKRLLQAALQSEGFYNSTIDGLFGRGTRASMSAWQTANGFEATGVMTTGQRSALLTAYNAILEGLGMVRTESAEAGIAMQMPMAQIAFKEFEAPFVHYESTTGEGIALSMISQEGGRARFQTLYAVLQTLDVVPPNGPRSLNRNRFRITGIDATRHTTVDVRYSGGEMKGYLLVWPAGDEKRLTRVLQEIETSFNDLPGVLDPGLSPPDEAQSIDLLAGLDIRQPRKEATGFFVNDAGLVLTAAETLGSCERVSLGAETDADIVFVDAALGLAALRPQQSIAPQAIATFQASVPRLSDQITVAGFSFGGDLGAPTLTLGELAELRGLNGEDTEKRLVLRAEPGDSGGPVFDQGGAVLGLLRPAPEREGQILPDTVRFAIDTDTIRERLITEGVVISEATTRADIDPVELSALAAEMSVLVQCW